MNDNNNERKIENVEKNEKEEIYDLEMKNLIHSKKNYQEEIPQSHSLLLYIKIIILIILLYKFSLFLNRIIQEEILKTNAYLITSQKIYWKNNKMINIKKINEEIQSYENISININNKQDLIRREYPKVSLIIPVYNQAQYIKRIYSNILNQTLKDIEIIFVDDLSTDNSASIIKELMEEDKRIVYIKNRENMGAFFSRNNGVINSRGEYVLLVDIDDFLLNDILLKSYETAKMYDLDILQFYVMAGDIKKNVFWKVLKYKSGIVRYEKVKEIFFRGTTRNTWDKFVKRKVFINSIKFMNNKFKKEKYVVYNDDVAIFGLIQSAQSYGFLEEIGYFYNWAVPNSTTHKYEDKKYINDIFRCCFTIMEYFYEQTKNKANEKIAGYTFFKFKVHKVYLKDVKYLTEGFDYIIKILDLYLNSNYYSNFQKKYLNEFKNAVLNITNENNI